MPTGQIGSEYAQSPKRLQMTLHARNVSFKQAYMHVYTSTHRHLSHVTFCRSKLSHSMHGYTSKHVCMYACTYTVQHIYIHKQINTCMHRQSQSLQLATTTDCRFPLHTYIHTYIHMHAKQPVSNPTASQHVGLQYTPKRHKKSFSDLHSHASK